MDCDECQTEVLRFPVGESFRSYVPEGAPGAVICPHCLAMDPDDDPPAEPPDFTRITAEFPTDPDAAVPMALAVGLLTSLALYRQDIAELFEAVEAAGVDPMLVVDRLAAAGAIDSQIDLRGRKRQLEQLLE